MTRDGFAVLEEVLVSVGDADLVGASDGELDMVLSGRRQGLCCYALDAG